MIDEAKSYTLRINSVLCLFIVKLLQHLVHYIARMMKLRLVGYVYEATRYPDFCFVTFVTINLDLLIGLRVFEHIQAFIDSSLEMIFVALLAYDTSYDGIGFIGSLECYGTEGVG